MSFEDKSGVIWKLRLCVFQKLRTKTETYNITIKVYLILWLYSPFDVQVIPNLKLLLQFTYSTIMYRPFSFYPTMYYFRRCIAIKVFKRGNLVPFWPLRNTMGLTAIFTVMHRGWVIVPQDLARPFDATCANIVAAGLPWDNINPCVI